MKLIELKDLREYINNPKQAISIHSIRYYNRVSGYEDSPTTKTMEVLDRNLSTNPSYFTYYATDGEGKVIGSKEIKGVTTWKQAEKWLNKEIKSNQEEQQ